jgi:hypothetical protein
LQKEGRVGVATCRCGRAVPTNLEGKILAQRVGGLEKPREMVDVLPQLGR